MRLCNVTTTTPIPGGVTVHACGLLRGHVGPHRCGSMARGMFPCHFTWMESE